MDEITKKPSNEQESTNEIDSLIDTEDWTNSQLVSVLTDWEDSVKSGDISDSLHDDEDDIEDDEDFDLGGNPIEGIINMIREKCNEFVSNVENLLEDWEELDDNQKAFVLSVFKQSSFWAKHPFLSTVNNLHYSWVCYKFSFDQLYSLSKLCLDEDHVWYFANILDSIDYLPDEDFDFLIDHYELINKDISEKLFWLKDLNESLEESYEHWILFSVFDLKDFKHVEVSDELEDKIKLLYSIGNSTLSDFLNISDLSYIDKIDLTDELIAKLNKLSDLWVSIYSSSLNYINWLDVNNSLVKKINLFNWYGVDIYSSDLRLINSLDLSNWWDKNLKYYMSKVESDKRNQLNVYNMCFAAGLSKDEIDKDLDISMRLWMWKFWLTHIHSLHGLSDEVINFCNDNNLRNASDIVIVNAFLSLAKSSNIRWYLQRKEDFVNKNKVLSDEKFKEYFGWKWKFDKDDIRQWGLGLCYMYTCLELFKKMNWFDAFIQSNCIEDEDWWKFRLPLNTWNWIRVRREEIDKKFNVSTGGNWLSRKVCINSDSDFLWSKILEIAYIKRLILENNDNYFFWEWSIEDPLDVFLSWWKLRDIEWWDTISTLSMLFWDWKIISWEIFNASASYKRLKNAHAPSSIINETKERIKTYKSRTEKLFDFHKTWLVAVEVGLSDMSNDCVKIKDVKVVDKFWNEIDTDDLLDEDDIFVWRTWKVSVELYSRHAYTLEKCYVDQAWNKIVRIVNPWHTDIKFDIPFKKAQELFKWNFWVIMIDELFKDE